MEQEICVLLKGEGLEVSYLGLGGKVGEFSSKMRRVDNIGQGGREEGTAPLHALEQHGGCHVRMSNLHLRKCGPIIEGLWSSFRVEVEITRGWPDISACARFHNERGWGCTQISIVNNLSHNWKLRYTDVVAGRVAGLEIEAAPFGV